MTAPTDFHWLGPFRFVGGPADGQTLDWISVGVEWVTVPALGRGGFGQVRYRVCLSDKTLR